MQLLALLVLLQADPKIEAAVEKGAEYLLRTRLEPAKHPFEKEFAVDELVLYALISAGRTDSETFNAILTRVIATEPRRTYNVSLQAMVLEELDRVKYQGRIAELAQWLVDTQATNGQWGYGRPPRNTATGSGSGGKPIKIKRLSEGPVNGDNSNSQYAALGLRACMGANVIIPDDTFKAALKFWERNQGADGGWGYNGEGSVNDPSCGSMTAGAIASLCILKSFLKVDPKKDAGLKKGIEWMGTNLTYDENPKYLKPKIWRYYWIYAVERTGMLFGVDKLGAHEWYKEGCAKLLSEQRGDGSWLAGEKDDESVGGAVADTCFAILFLRKATKVLPRVATASK